VERLAAFLAGLDVDRHGSGRVFLPVPLPGGAGGAWRCGLSAFRETLFRGEAPGSACVLAADGWTGRAVAHGASRDAAMEAWRRRVEEVRPFPGPPPPPDDLPESSMEQEATEDGFRIRATLRGPKSDVPPVEPAPENTAAATIHVPALPEAPPSFGAWTRLVGRYGEVFPAALRWEPEGFTMVGDRLLPRFDPERLEEQLAVADAKADEEDAAFPPPDTDAPVTDTRLRVYPFLDPETGQPIEPRAKSGAWTRGFHAGNLEGDRLRGSVVRMRPDDSRSPPR
jgi:hypothetical protein